MLQHINGLKKDKKKLLKLLEEVPPLPENTAELESEASKSKTLSEKYDSDEGEQKDGSSYTLPLQVKQEKEAIEVQVAQAPPSCFTNVSKPAPEQGSTLEKNSELKHQNSQHGSPDPVKPDAVLEIKDVDSRQ